MIQNMQKRNGLPALYVDCLWTRAEDIGLRGVQMQPPCSSTAVSYVVKTAGDVALKLWTQTVCKKYP